MKRFFWEFLFIVFISIFTGMIFNTFYLEGINLKKFNPAPNIKKEAKGLNIPVLNLTGAKEKFDRGAIFIDARSNEEFKKGRIKFSFNIPSGNEEKFWEEFSQFCPPGSNEEIVVYCDGKDCHASLNVAKFLKDKGYKKVYIFTGGWNEWMEKGYPIEWE